MVGCKMVKGDLFLLNNLNYKILPWNIKNEEYFFKEISLGLMPLDLKSDFANFVGNFCWGGGEPGKGGWRTRRAGHGGTGVGRRLDPAH